MEIILMKLSLPLKLTLKHGGIDWSRKGPYTNHVTLRGRGVRQNTTSNHEGEGGLAENHVTFPPIFAFLFPTKQGNCHLLRALNQATSTLWEEEVEKDSIF